MSGLGRPQHECFENFGYGDQLAGDGGFWDGTETVVTGPGIRGPLLPQPARLPQTASTEPTTKARRISPLIRLRRPLGHIPPKREPSLSSTGSDAVQ